jgi:hypothetical protein
VGSGSRPQGETVCDPKAVSAIVRQCQAHSGIKHPGCGPTTMAVQSTLVAGERESAGAAKAAIAENPSRYFAHKWRSASTEEPQYFNKNGLGVIVGALMVVHTAI